MYVKIYWNVFKMQTDNDNFRKNVAADKTYILRKMSLNFQKFRSNISCKIQFCIFFVINWNSLALRGQWGTSINDWIWLYALVS